MRAILQTVMDTDEDYFMELTTKRSVISIAYLKTVRVKFLLFVKRALGCEGRVLEKDDNDNHNPCQLRIMNIVNI